METQKLHMVIEKRSLERERIINTHSMLNEAINEGTS
jgi:hypothetical protein